MRELKFRAYLSHWSTMLFSDDYENVGIFFQMVLNDQKMVGPSFPIIMMQFIGVKDKNGTEIYEDDIIRTQEYKAFSDTYRQNDGKRYLAVVKQSTSEQIVGWSTEIKNYLSSFGFGEKGDFHDCEVVGNIHQNKELI